MGSRLELRKSSRNQHHSKVGKERVLLPQSKQSPCPAVSEKSKMKSLVPPRGDLYSASRKETDIIREQSFMHWQSKSVKGCQIGDDELVRHMSNLPGYLLHAEGGVNLQEKAFNVGVLDWGRLENWKHKQMNGSIKGKNDASCSRDNLLSKQTTTRISTLPHVVQSEIAAPPHSSLRSGLISSHNDKEEHLHCVTSFRNAIHCLDSDSGSKSAMKGRQKIQRTCTSSGRINTNVMYERERTKRSDRKIGSDLVNFSSHVRHSGVSPCPKGNINVLDGKANSRIEKLIATNIQNKGADERVILEVGQLPSKSSYDISHSLNDRTDVGNNETKKGTGKQCSAIDLPQQYFTYKQDINLRQKQKSRTLDEEIQPLPSRTSFDETVTDVNSSCYSEIFSPEILSSECGSEIPYSCPLPSLADTDAMMATVQDFLVNDGTVELSSATAQSSSNSNQKSILRPSEDARSENGKSDSKLTHSELVDALEALDDETTEQGARKGRHPSPNRRFSFSLGRIGRSFSFKESSTVPQLSSTYITPKSGPVISDNAACTDNSDGKKLSGHNRTRSSPLRRLIEPILKHKSSTPQHYIEGNFNSLGFWNTGPGSQKKHAASTIRALLQFSIKNGFPLFKLLVDNNRNILAATIRDLKSSGKNESGQNYTFYWVNEIKRKNGGWIRPGNREKSYGYAYNVIAQMKVNSELKTSEHDNNERYMLRESVLLGVEMRPVDQQSGVIVKNRELAAVVLKIPIENLSHDGQQSDRVLTGDCLKSEDNAVVILPGAVHGSPSSGEPSPLINRWRSGGSCDCGGWDVGCKLRVLSIPNKQMTSRAHPTPDRLELFILEGQQNKPVFSLAPLKGGIFEIHFDSSISMLQAFFTCVAVLSCQQPADLPEPSKFASTENIKYPNSNGFNIVREKATASVRYAPNPPLSPVGRV